MTINIDLELATVVWGLVGAVGFIVIWVWVFWQKMRKELIAARVAVLNLQTRVAELERGRIAFMREGALTPPPIPQHPTDQLDDVIRELDHAGDKVAARRNWKQLTGKA